MKLTEFSKASNEDYLWLKEQTDKLPENKAFLFTNCALPSDCFPAKVTLGIYRKQSGYEVFFSKPIQYTGNHSNLKLLCKGKSLSFKSFEVMKAFFKTLTNEAFNAAIQIEPVIEMPVLIEQPIVSVLSEETILKELEKRIIGQDMAIATIASQVALHLKKTNPKKPLSIMTYGQSGCGKSEAAKTVGDILSTQDSNEYSTVRTELNTFNEAHSVYRLIGSPPGYVGYDDTPIFEAVTHNPYTVFIFDELDKAHPSVLQTFMSILDEGRCASRKELEDKSREFDFHHCIFIFTSNFSLNQSGGELGFSLSDRLTNISRKDNVVKISYKEPESKPDESIQQIYKNTESARKAFVESGVLKEIASRFDCFIEFKELSEEAKAQILAKQVIETGFEYNIQLVHITSSIMESLITATTSSDALTVRSFKSVIEGYLATAFAKASEDYENQALSLSGDIKKPQIEPYKKLKNGI